MEGYQPSRIRNIALVGHNGSGKTTLCESLLFANGAIPKKGSVDAGNSVCDFEPEEVNHHMSISMALAPFLSEQVKINVIDCPGYVDFFEEVRTALSVVDLAVVVISGVEGMEPQTREVWDYLNSLRLPRMVFVNKLDRDNSDFNRVLDQASTELGEGILPVQFPAGVASGLKGIVDLSSNTYFDYEQSPPTAKDIPAEMEIVTGSMREKFIEGTVVADDDLMERYLEGTLPDQESLSKTLSKAVSGCNVFPVLCGSAANDIGIDLLTKAIVRIAPPPDSRPGPVAIAGDTEVKIPCDPKDKEVLRVFKTFSDPYVGKISMMKVLSGTVRPDSTLINSTKHTEERLHVIELLRGKHSEPITEAMAGDILAVPKLAGTSTFDTLSAKGFPITVESPPMGYANYAVAIEPRTKDDEDKLMTALHKLQDEDIALRVERVDETHQTLLWAMGDTHIHVLLERLARKNSVEVSVTEIAIPYRETITRQAEAEGKYKKQTGGHGQYGVANIRIEPLERGGGFVFSDKVVGGAIPKQYIPAVQKGIEESMMQGGVYGYPVVDVHVICYDGKYHPVDSSELSFKMAGALAFREALANAGPVMLEPISKIQVSVPEALQGDILGDLSARRGHVQGSEPGSLDGIASHMTTITAFVPTSEITRYALDLRSITGGRGKFRSIHDHYDALPSNLVEKLRKS